MFRVIMTRASPTAATATIDARTATWLRFESVRNCGAVTDTSPPSTNMIATRLSSRWRAIVDNHCPRVRPAPTVAVTPDLAIEATAGGFARGFGDRLRGVVAGHVAGRGEHHPLLGRPIARNLGRDPPFVEDKDPVGHCQDFRQVAGDEDDPEPRRCQLTDDPVDLDLGADVDPARGLVQDQDPGPGGQPLGQHDFLLVAAR